MALEGKLDFYCHLHLGGCGKVFWAKPPVERRTDETTLVIDPLICTACKHHVVVESIDYAYGKIATYRTPNKLS